jgi:hypothetical protein
MNRWMRWGQVSLLAVLSALAAGAAQAQFVKGNEAVRVMPDGTRKVETPPTKGALLAAPCLASTGACAGSGWRMVETRDGIQECTEFYARPGTCQPSTYGVRKASRVWVVKVHGQWQQCQYPDIASKCVKLSALPHPALQ